MMTIQNEKREVKLWLQISKLKIMLILQTITFEQFVLCRLKTDIL